MCSRPFSFDGQSGALPPPAGTLLWAEENVGAYERSVGGEHGTDVPVRVDRSLIGKRNIVGTSSTADGGGGALNADVVLGVQDFAHATRCEVRPQPRATALAKKLGMAAPPISSGGPFAYGLVARAEAQMYLDLPETVS